MKTFLVSACVMWMALAVELASPGLLPHGSLLLPIACGIMFWTRSTVGLLFASLVLLLDWIARPSTLPLCPMLLPFLAVLCLAPSSQSQEYRTQRATLKIPPPLQLPLLTLAALVLQILGTLTFAQFQAPSLALSELTGSLKSLAVISLPVSAVLSLLIRMADEFGMRRSFS